MRLSRLRWLLSCSLLLVGLGACMTPSPTTEQVLVAPLSNSGQSSQSSMTREELEDSVRRYADRYFTRVALAGVFWRSGRTKVEEGSWFDLTDTTYFLFENEYSGVPLPADIAAPMATYAETFFPILLVLGLATRFSALALLGMTLVIQFLLLVKLEEIESSSQKYFIYLQEQCGGSMDTMAGLEL